MAQPVDRQRIFDLALAVPGIIALAPLLLVVSALVRVFDGSPVLFRHTRVGKDFEPFEMVKFRTMSTPKSTAKQSNLSALNDPRITPLGSWLRRLKIDELPQLINVIQGSMSLVGSRPEVSEFVELEPEAFARLLTRRPGIADPAAITYRDEDAVLAQFPAENRRQAYIDQVLPEKLAISLDYHDTRTVRSDVAVLFRTVAESLKMEKSK